MKTSSSLGGLINLSALNKALKKADTVLWMRSDATDRAPAYDYISDGRFALRVRIPAGAAAFATLAGLFGTIPHGKVLRWNRGTGVTESALDFEKVLVPELVVVVDDTFLTAHVDGLDLRVYRGDTEYITLSVLYADMIGESSEIWSPSGSPRDGLLFLRNDEAAFILPVRTGQSAPFARFLARDI